MTDSTTVAKTGDGSAVAAPRLAAIQRTYEEEKARIVDPAPSADAAPASTDPGPEDVHQLAVSCIADMARCAPAAPAPADADAGTKRIYLRAVRPLSACAETRPEQQTAARPPEPKARAG